MTRTPPSGKTASRLRYTAASLVLCAWLLGIGQASGPKEPWQARFGQDHPLVGRIWEVEAARVIDITMLVQRLTNGRFVLLGEKHDNPDHHRLQAWILGALLDAGRRPAVGFEMFAIDDGPAIARHVAAHPTDAAGLAEVVHWHRSGWPDWSLYQPLAEIALRAKLPLVATNLSQATARALGHGNLSASDAALAARLGLDRPLAPDIHAAMAAEIREAHCGFASEAQVDAMITMQRARDAQMAASLAAAGRQDGAVLIAGAGHVRKDYGVPMHLVDKALESTVLSVALLEVSQGVFEPTAYAARFQRAKLPFDYVWFTPRVDDQDPCQHFEEQLKRLQRER